MDVTSVEGVLLAMLVVVPGGVGDLVMRSVTNMPEPRSDFSRVLSALSWSTATLVLCELAISLGKGTGFGDFLLDDIMSADGVAGVTQLAPRYLIYFVSAVALPTIVRSAARWRQFETLFRGRTLLEPSLDRLFYRYVPPPPPGTAWPPYARVRMGEEVAEGWVLWMSSGEGPESGLILRAAGSQGALWIPGESATSVELVDLSYEHELHDRIAADGSR